MKSVGTMIVGIWIVLEFDYTLGRAMNVSDLIYQHVTKYEITKQIRCTFIQQGVHHAHIRRHYALYHYRILVAITLSRIFL